MKFRRLGKTEMKVSEISLGTWQVGGGWGKPFNVAAASSIIESALELGINFLDTADVYDDQQSERIVGKYVKANRDKWHIATKIGRRVNPHVSDGYTPQVLSDYVDEALQNTGLQYLDLVQLHCPPTPVFYRDEIFKELEEIKASGKVRHFGVSVEKVEEALQVTTYDVIETVQIIFNMFRQKPVYECFDVLKSRDVGVIVRVPLASGLLSGKIKPDHEFSKEDHRSFNRNGEVFDKGETFSGVPLNEGFAAVDLLKDRFGPDLYRYALKWILMFEQVSTVIPGASRAEQLVSNVEATKVPDFTLEDMDFVRHVYDKFIRADVHELW